MRTLIWKALYAWRGYEGDRISYLEELRGQQWLPPESMRELQQRRLTAMLNHAYQHVPYYREAFETASVVQHGRVDAARFESIPLLDRSALRENFTALTSSHAPPAEFVRNSTGGSTGRPVQFLQDVEYRARTEAIKALREEWTGIRPGSRRALLWGAPRDLLVGNAAFRTRLRRWARNELWMNAYRMSPSDIREYVRRLQRFRPETILGYPELLYDFARFVERESLSVPAPVSVSTGSGPIDPEMRETIERVFGARVFNRYGSREFGSIGSDCECHEGLHVSAPHLLVEILRSDGSRARPEEVGEVVVTGLINRAMPLIRYRLGDMTAWVGEPCSCGRGWPLLRPIAGRTNSVFRKQDGQTITTDFFQYLARMHNAWIERFTFIQEDYNFIRVLVVAPADAGHQPGVRYAAEIAELQEQVRRGMGDACEVRVEFVPDIEVTASGKHRYCISRLAEQEMSGPA